MGDRDRKRKTEREREIMKEIERQREVKEREKNGKLETKNGRNLNVFKVCQRNVRERNQ